MQAAVLRKVPGELEIEDLTVDAIGPHELLVRTAHSGLCHSDLHFIDGVWAIEPPLVMGHEGAGIVEAVGSDVTYVRPGDHVVTCVSVFCGQCRQCLSGRPHLCENRESVLARPAPALRDRNGAAVRPFGSLGTFAAEMLVHEHAVAKIRDEMPLDIAALIGCAVTTGVGAVVRTAAVEPGSSVAVVGCGGIGLAAIQGARLVGASPVIAVDVAEDKLERARAVGATHTVNARDNDPVAVVRELTRGGVDYSFEAIGTKRTAEQCFAMLGRHGTATVIGMVPADAMLEISGAALFGREQRIQGSMMGSNRFRLDMPWFCDLYLDGRLKLDEMVTAHRPLAEINEGYDVLRRGEGARTVIDFPL
jgi:S-(hydroxymethyl)glutathione dehydrogenase/alcohol dehydrogenase